VIPRSSAVAFEKVKQLPIFFLAHSEPSPVNRVDGAPFDNAINLVNTVVGDRTVSILAALVAGRFRFSLHAAQRMRERSVTKADIQACGRTARSCVYQAESATYRMDGEDLDGEPLTVICGADDVVVLVRIF
jgi:hypothetical protein